MRRFQARRSSGRFTRNTPENTLGLHIGVCPGRDEWCGRLLPVAVGEKTPDFCEDHDTVGPEERTRG